MAKTGNKNGKNEYDLAKMSQKQFLQGFPKLLMHFQDCPKGFVESHVVQGCPKMIMNSPTCTDVLTILFPRSGI